MFAFHVAAATLLSNLSPMTRSGRFSLLLNRRFATCFSSGDPPKRDFILAKYAIVSDIPDMHSYNTDKRDQSSHPYQLFSYERTIPGFGPGCKLRYWRISRGAEPVSRVGFQTISLCGGAVVRLCEFFGQFLGCLVLLFTLTFF